MKQFLRKKIYFWFKLSSFFTKSRLRVWSHKASDCDTLELDQFLHHGAQIRQFLYKKIAFGSFSKKQIHLAKSWLRKILVANSFSKILVARLAAFTAADRFFKRL